MDTYTPTPGHRIGFISFRFAGTDGVSLETAKWVSVLEEMGNTCFYFAGIADTPEDRTMIVPEAFFSPPDLQSAVFAANARFAPVSRKISELQRYLKTQLQTFIRRFDIDILVLQNAVTIPLNIPLGLAITEVIAETELPTIAHHHDFFWERDRFLSGCGWDYLSMAFPPVLPSMRHVVISSLGAKQLSHRHGVTSTLIPNVMDFENPPSPPDAYVADLRRDLGVSPDEFLILQPTRVIQRKGIESTIELVRRMGNKVRLVISHASGDEGDAYEGRIREFSRLLEVDTIFVSDIIGDKRGTTPDGRKIYTLQDVYQQADLMTYPSLIEGFGNALLEAVYFKTPVVVNNYPVYTVDIKPKGFRFIEMDGYIRADTVEQSMHFLTDKRAAAEMTEANYRIARRHYSFALLRRKLADLLVDIEVDKRAAAA